MDNLTVRQVNGWYDIAYRQDGQLVHATAKRRKGNMFYVALEGTNVWHPLMTSSAREMVSRALDFLAMRGYLD